MTKCNVIKDLLPLYVDNVCSSDSKEMVEEHLKTCPDCQKELEFFKGMDFKEVEKKEKKEFQLFSKSINRKMYKKVVIGAVVGAFVLGMIGFVFSVPEFTVEYSKELVEVAIPEDGGIDMNINLANYKNAYATYANNGDGTCDVYIIVKHNLFTMLWKDSDPSDHLVRIGNRMCASFNNSEGIVQFYLPEDMEVSHIYYVDQDVENLLLMEDEELRSVKSVMIWKKEV